MARARGTAVPLRTLRAGSNRFSIFSQLPVHTLNEVIEELDLVLVMTVNPGVGGQLFIDYTLRKIRQVRETLDARNPRCEVEVDGGIEAHTIRAAYQAGARVFVAGTSVFHHAAGPGAGLRDYPGYSTGISLCGRPDLNGNDPLCSISPSHR